MEYKIILTPIDVTKFILNASPVINGTALITLGETLLKKNLEHAHNLKYSIFGNVTNYTLSVPSATAVASGKFANTDTFYVSCPEDYLRKYLHQLAHVTHPGMFMDVKINITEEIDELRLIRDWAAANYPASLE